MEDLEPQSIVSHDLLHAEPESVQEFIAGLRSDDVAQSQPIDDPQPQASAEALEMSKFEEQKQDLAEEEARTTAAFGESSRMALVGLQNVQALLSDSVTHDPPSEQHLEGSIELQECGRVVSSSSPQDESPIHDLIATANDATASSKLEDTYHRAAVIPLGIDLSVYRKQQASPSPPPENGRNNLPTEFSTTTRSARYSSYERVGERTFVKTNVATPHIIFGTTNEARGSGGIHSVQMPVHTSSQDNDDSDAQFLEDFIDRPAGNQVQSRLQDLMKEY